MPVNPSDVYFAQLTVLTKMSPKEWSDFLSCTPPEQAIIAKGYKDQDWVQSTDTFAKVMEILAVIGSIAGVVSGVAGAAGAIAALKAI
jgi:hypothetical protein